mmetsp:Transcript_78700/g.159742  ORF Transcript_78700/g.159742 Transcript_78700/m.159742 type:complete len:165 (+) Transcript_78700:140-634(+)
MCCGFPVPVEVPLDGTAGGSADCALLFHGNFGVGTLRTRKWGAPGLALPLPFGPTGAGAQETCGTPGPTVGVAAAPLTTQGLMLSRGEGRGSGVKDRERNSCGAEWQSARLGIVARAAGAFAVEKPTLGVTVAAGGATSEAATKVVAAWGTGGDGAGKKKCARR